MEQKRLQQAVEWPLKHSSTFLRLGVSPVRGILLHGPPGCSKTTLAKAAACAAQASFFSLRYVLVQPIVTLSGPAINIIGLKEEKQLLKFGQ